MNKRKPESENRSNIRAIQIIITVGAVLIALTHLVWPALSIDSITIILVLIAIIPWLTPLFKSLEFPGGWKVEFREMQNIKDKADKAGLLAAEEKGPKPEYVYLQIAEQDANLALAGLRIEIEKRLIQIAQANDIPVQRSSVGQMLRLLSDREILTNDERSVLADIVGILNSAVHGATVDKNTADLAMEMGTRLLKALDEKIPDREVV